MIELPNITLIAIDTLAHDLTRQALERCLKKAHFGEVIVWSDKEKIRPRDFAARLIYCKPNTPKIDYAKIMWYEVPEIVSTSHYLLIQWDSWILNPAAWTDSFLEYDFIGAPWWYNDENNVGCDGFSLKSLKLAHFLAENKDEFPLGFPEDHILCRVFGPRLKSLGVRFAPEHIAYKFSRERTGWDREGVPFGFHGMFNFPRFMKPAELTEFLENDYVKAKVEYPELVKIAENMKNIRT